MFKNKILIYLESGNIIKLRSNDYDIGEDENGDLYISADVSIKYYFIQDDRIEAITVKYWWQPWGIA